MLLRWLLTLPFLLGPVLGPNQLSPWQEAHLDEFWQKMHTEAGVEFYLLRHRQADAVRDAVVILVRNRNDYPIAYRFRPVFRSATREVEFDYTTGTLGPNEAVTGTHSGLTWMPFPDDDLVVQAGLRGLSVQRVAL